jgi:hypothetical protein
MASRTQSQWTLSGRGDYDKLSLNKQAPIPYVGDNDVLVRSRSIQPSLFFIVTIDRSEGRVVQFSRHRNPPRQFRSGLLLLSPPSRLVIQPTADPVIEQVPLLYDGVGGSPLRRGGRCGERWAASDPLQEG